MHQVLATFDLVIAYQGIVATGILLLTVRNLARKWQRRTRNRSLAATTESLEKEDAPLGTSRYGRFERWFLRPLESKWALGFENLFQATLFLLVLAVNVTFIVIIDTDFRGDQEVIWNKIHVVALRCGALSIAQLPAVFLLMGRNSPVQTLTGIEYQNLRYLHKLLARWAIVHGILHTLEATGAEFIWSRAPGLVTLYEQHLGTTGVIMVVGFALAGIFSIHRLRMAHYELFLITHITGVIMVLVAFCIHVPSLAYWVYIAASFWAYERLARVLRTIPLRTLFLHRTWQHRAPPLVQAHATLINGAITLLVPTEKRWTSGQHAYLTICDPAFPLSSKFQPHPFSIANLPTDDSVDAVNEMLFVIKVRDGMTKTVAKKLEHTPGKSLSVWVVMEGPYGTRVRTEEFQDILMVGGGSGISHCMSVLSEAILPRPSQLQPQPQRVTLVWTVQTTDQLEWALPRLLSNVDAASQSGVTLTIHLFYTRSPAITDASEKSSDSLPLSSTESLPSFSTEIRLPSSMPTLSQELSMRTNITLTPGRPTLDTLVSDFVTGARGRSLVTTCGPTSMTKVVAAEVSRLAASHPVALDLAVFEC